MKIVCANCGNESKKSSSSVNRANRISAPLYCNRTCAGLARRRNKSAEQKKNEKAIYDALYRAKNRSIIKTKKREYFQRTYDPEKARIARRSTMDRHIEYCRRPEYRAWKAEYDRKYRAREYGPFSDAYLLLLSIDQEVNTRITDYETRMQNGTINKALQRRRDYEKAYSNRA